MFFTDVGEEFRNDPPVLIVLRLAVDTLLLLALVGDRDRGLRRYGDFGDLTFGLKL